MMDSTLYYGWQRTHLARKGEADKVEVKLPKPDDPNHLTDAEVEAEVGGATSPTLKAGPDSSEPKQNAG